MKRRKFIKDSLLSTSLLFVPQLLAQNSNKKMEEKSVIIIGAGVSGLAAAQHLQKKGIEVLVLEAQSKIGGRLKTDRSIQIPFDEGASWIHGPKGNPITDLVEKSGMKTFMTDNNSLEIFDIDGRSYKDNETESAYKAFNKALKQISENGENNESFESVFNRLYPQHTQKRLWKYMLSAYTEFDAGGDIGKLSSTEFDNDENFDGKDIIITNGYDKLAQYLAQNIEIKLNQKVMKIDYSKEEVKVITNNQTYKADYVIVSVPLGVLKKNIISFVPNLPDNKQKSINRLQMGNVNKFLLIFPSTFWDNQLQYIGFTPEIKGQYNYFLNINKFAPQSHALMTFAFGNYADKTETLNDNELVKEIMTNLRAIYKNAPNPAKTLRTQWGKNPFSYGAYSFASVGSQKSDFDSLAKNIEDKIFFAGEHTHNEYRSTVHGAYLSGIREANKIIEL